MKRTIFIIILLLIAGTSWGFSAYQFKKHEADLVIQLESVFMKLALPYHIARLSLQDPDTKLHIPIQGLLKRDLRDTWGDARSEGRTHQGVDMFAKRGTPIFSATDGFVVRTGTNELGGIIVFVMGKGGVRYYYAHLDSIAKGIEVGKEVTTDTVLGFVGNTGNAVGTPPHLHFGMYRNGPENPFELLETR